MTPLVVLVICKCVILVDKCVNFKLKWMENYDTKPTQNNKKKTSSHAQSTCNEDSMWWVLIASNNPLLKLPFCPLITVSDDMLLKIYHENVVTMLLI